VSKHGAIEVPQAVDWILQACDAIAEAHASGIVHRDLKPANLFLTKRSDGSDCIKVLDFGISKRIASTDSAHFQASLTATRQVVGSPAYMSPEQVRNSRDIDFRVDIWALGMTLYEFLSGRPAFCADTFPAVCAAIIADTPVSIRKATPHIPESLDQVVLRCLEKDPAKRFASIDELAAALLPFAPAYARSTRSFRQQSPARTYAVQDMAPATLASAHSSNDIRSSGPRGIEPAGTQANRTLCSSEPQAAPAPPVSAVSTRATSKRSIWLLLGVVGFALGVAWKLHNGAPHPKPAPEPMAAANSAQFMVRFESEPPGAEVWENNRLLGMTPLEYPIEHASVLHRPRTFTLRAENYMPFTVTQANSLRDVVVTAHLANTPKPPEQVNLGPSPSAHGALRPHAVPVPAAKNATATKPADTLPIDIRTQR
jgi:serine/threonine-protein kinase